MKLTENEYANGLLKACDQTIYFCQGKIDKIKASKTKPNTPRQITESGKVLAFQLVINRMKVRKANILKNL